MRSIITGHLQHLEEDDPVISMANLLAGCAPEICKKHGLTGNQFCVALANALGFVLADYQERLNKPPFDQMRHREQRKKAHSQIDDYMRVMKASYDIRSIKKSAAA